MVNPVQQRLLLDTDAYSKLGAAGLFQDALDILGISIAECGRLPALPYMLRKGGLRERLGKGAADALLPQADGIVVAVSSSDEWLEPLRRNQPIDAGEAQLFAAAAEFGMMVLTGDKRALEQLKNVPRYASALAGRILTLEAILYETCAQLGEEPVRERIGPFVPVDRMFSVCFSSDNPSPLECLRSYYNDLVSNVAPLELWRPPSLDEQPLEPS